MDAVPVDAPPLTRRSRVGVFRPSDRTWTLDANGNDFFDGCAVDRCLPPFTANGDLPVVGDWSGTGRTAIGVYRRADRTFTLDANNNGSFDGCTVDRCFGFGSNGDQPVAGDWTGTGRSSIGIFRPSERIFALDLNGNGFFDSCAVDRCSGAIGEFGDTAVVGAWSAGGRHAIGVFRPRNQVWGMDLNGNALWDGCDVDRCTVRFGLAGDLPVAGDWDGSGRSRIGVFRPSTADWSLDVNDNAQWDGCGVDRCVHSFGGPGDLPVVGHW